jgi:hypothetical protein
LLEVDGTAAQIVIDPREHTVIFDDLRLGQMLKLEVTPATPSPKGEAAHPVHHFHSLVAVDGKRPQPAASIQRVFKGRVERLNYAKHGEPNGVVLDSGDFIHLRPQGFRDAALRVGDAIQAEGDARPMVSGGFVVEARQVNDVSIEPKKPKPPKRHGGPKHGPKHGDRHEGKAHPAH